MIRPVWDKAYDCAVQLLTRGQDIDISVGRVNN